MRLVAEVPFAGSLTLRRYRLDNGLVVLVVVDRAAPVASYQTWFRVGSRDERPGKTGLAHLFEHLMFNETRNLGAGEFDRRIENAGGETNAATWTDWTHYHSELPASELLLAVELEADRMANLVLRPPQLASEKEVVQNERRLRVEDDVFGLASEVLYATAFQHHPYRWPTIGWMDDIAGFTTRDCERFYRAYYAPNNATLVVVGDVDEDALIARIARCYGRLRRETIRRPKRAVEPRQRAERARTLRRPTPSEKLALGYRAPALGDADHVALSVANEILFGGRGSRLFRKLVEDAGLVADLSGDVAPFADPGLYELWFSMREGQRGDRVLAIVDRELGRLRDRRVPRTEIERVKSRAELGFLLGLETAPGKAEQIGFYETVLGDARLLFERLEHFRRIDADDVQRVARRYLRPSQRTRVDVLPA